MAGFADALRGQISAELLSELTQMVDREKVEQGIETVTSGALSLGVVTSLISVTGTQAYTLADGSFEGQRKVLRVIVAASTPDGTLTPANFADGTSIDLDAVDEQVELQWTGSDWRVIRISGATVS